VTLLVAFFSVSWRAAQRAESGAERALLAACLAAVGGNAAGNLVSFDVTATAAATALVMAIAVGLTRRRQPLLNARPAGRAPNGADGPGRLEQTGQRASGRVAAAFVLMAATGIGIAVWQANVRPVAADVAARIADQRSAAGDWQGAIDAAEQAVALWPREPAYRRALSWACLERATQAGAEAGPWLQRAESELVAARDLRPLDYRTWAALGEMYGVWGNRWDPGKLPLAHHAYARATELAPHQATLYTAWGMVDLAGGRFAPAAARFRQAVDLDATDGYAFAHLGEAELAAGQIGEAAVAYGQAVRWAPQLSAAHVGLARCNWLQGRRQAAEMALERALELDPDSSTALALRQEMSLPP